MKAFGTFASEVSLDFTRFEQSPLVLIHGPTGAGKTTILDAICFALFGDASGDERKGSEMRCDHAAPEVDTEVVFDFALGARRFRVRRVPDYLRPKKRGEGFTKQPHKATLWERTDAADDEDEGRVLATKPGDVTDEVHELFGFESQQFRRVVVLPQGRFRDLLLADSKDKEKILQSLFDTERLKRIEDTLERRASELRSEVKALRERRDQELRGSDSEDEDTERAPATLEELSEQIDGAVEELNAAGDELGRHKEALKLAEDALDAGTRAQGLLKEVADAEADVAASEAEAEALEDKRTRVAVARSALPLRPLEEPLERLRLSVAQKESDATSAAEAQEKSAAALAAATEAVEKENAKEGELAEARAERTRLDDLGSRVAGLEVHRRGAEEAAALLQGASAALTTARQVREDKRAARQAQQTARAERAAVAGGAADARAAAAVLEKALGLRKKLAAAAAQLAEASEAEEGAARAREAAEAARSAARTQSETLRSRWDAAQAGRLARSLDDDEPCPVCGSTDHPAPAQAPPDLPSEEQLQGADDELRAAEKEASEAAARAQAAAQARELRTTRVEELEAELGADAGRALEELEAATLEARAAADNADAADVERARLDETLGALATELEAADAEVERATKAESDAQSSHAAAEATLTHAAEGIDEALRSEAALAAALEQAAARVTTLEEARKSADARLVEATAGAGRAAEQLEGSRRALTDAESERVRAEEELRARREEAGLDDDDDWARAREDLARLDALEADVKAADQRAHAAAERLARAREKAAEVEAPDLEALGGRKTAAAATLEAATARRAALQTELKQLRARHQTAKTLGAELARKETEQRATGHLADVARGRVAPGISFQRWMLGAMLDEVLASATERLFHMSKHRFRLQREETADRKGKAAGLDLVVVDEYRGTRRRVSTLSGGESFLAALSLALGLADVVQRHSGGIHLDTLFIDEGFGTLDADSLDLALDVLTELNKSGRLVGVISHVSELKARIPSRIEVTPGAKGSQLSVTTG
jgi:exonuclease SbcC